MRAQTRALIEGFKGAEDLRPVFAAGAAHLVGTSGAVSSLAGLHLNLTRYQRSRVDGLWMSRAEVAQAAQRVVAMDRAARAVNACIGEERADLIGPGAAIFEAVCDAWPSARVRVADRGLREGVLLDLIQGAQK
jgi:exopolyphosphatase/guanosine-5'-triphosphate,3'-diphosphate pyrophosphatase